MSFFKKAIGIFVELDEKSNLNEVPTQKNEVEKDTTSVPTQTFNFDSTVPDKFKTTEISSTPQSTQGAFNEEFYNHLQREIEKNDLDGADYFEFRQTFEALKKSMPEIAALTASYAALRATSPELTVVRLLETADVYLGVVNQEDIDFEKQYQENHTSEVVGRENVIDDENLKQNDWNQQIEALEVEILASKEKQHALEVEKITEGEKLNSVKANWDVTIQLVKNNIETDKKNILTYLEPKTV